MKTAMFVKYTTAATIRCVARQALPEYGLTEGQVFYLCASKTLGEHWYHVVVWSYERMQWVCPCLATVARCKHVKTVSQDCCKAHTLHSYKPIEKPVNTASKEVETFDMQHEVQKVAAFITRAKTARTMLPLSSTNNAFSLMR